MSTVVDLLLESGVSLDDADRRVRHGLEDALSAQRSWLPDVLLEGQLLRPLVAYAGWVGASRAGAERSLWSAAAAVQLAHEASLLHDDVLDGASIRRGAPTVVASHGVAAALVGGDHLLTAAYRLAAATGSAAFVALFARAVERTVAGEIAQARSAATPLSFGQYRQIVLGKSGELLGVALASGACLSEPDRVDPLFELGRRLGLLYQMVDDLLDYCPNSPTGKPAFSDHRQGKWTWPLAELSGSPLDRSGGEVLAELCGAGAPAGATPPLLRCVGRLRSEVSALATEISHLLPGDLLLHQIVDVWLLRAEHAAEGELRAAASADAPVEDRLAAFLPKEDRLGSYLHHHSRSFRFASRFFPRTDREWIERLYAFCRVTDDIGDSPAPLSTSEREQLLDRWERLAERAYGGTPSGIGFLDRLMEESAAAGIPFAYPSELIEGVRMDLRGVRYATPDELDLYMYRVASVVGAWITRFAGVRRAVTVSGAVALGRGMQLTNILRDVGEDLGAGRLYLPASILEDFGLSETALRAMRAGHQPISERYREMIESLLIRAEAEYAASIPRISDLPRAYRAPVAVAAHVYRGIHGVIRANGHDNLTRRAVVSGPARARYAAAALLSARFVPDPVRTGVHPTPRPAFTDLTRHV